MSGYRYNDSFDIPDIALQIIHVKQSCRLIASTAQSLQTASQKFCSALSMALELVAWAERNSQILSASFAMSSKGPDLETIMV